MKRMAELSFFCLIAIVVGLGTNKISLEVSMLKTLRQTVNQNERLCNEIRGRNELLLGLEEANLNLKTSLDESVELVTSLSTQVEDLSREIDRLKYLVGSKERTIEQLQDTISDLRKLIQEEANDTDNSISVETP